MERKKTALGSKSSLHAAMFKIALSKHRSGSTRRLFFAPQPSDSDKAAAEAAAAVTDAGGAAGGGSTIAVSGGPTAAPAGAAPLLSSDSEDDDRVLIVRESAGPGFAIQVNDVQIPASRPSTAVSLRSTHSVGSEAFEVTFDEGFDEDNIRKLFGEARPGSQGGSRPGSRPSQTSGASGAHRSRSPLRPRKRLSSIGRAVGWREIWLALEKDSIERLQRRFSRETELNRDEFAQSVVEALRSELVRAPATQLFAQIDADGSGSLRWGEFLDFVLGSVGMVLSAPPPPVLRTETVRVSLPLRQRPQQSTSQIRYVPEIDRFLTCDGHANTATLWSPEGVMGIQLKEHRAPVQDVTYAPELHSIITGSTDRIVALWDERRFAVTKRIFSPDPVQSVHYCKDAHSILTGTDSGKVYVWDVNSCKRKQTLELHKDWVHLLCEIPFANVVVCGSLDGDMSLWDVATGSVHVRHSFGIGAVRSVAYSAVTTLMLTAGGHRTVVASPPVSGKPVYTMRGHEAPVASVFAVDWAPQAVSVDELGVVKVWDLRVFAPLQTIHTECHARTAAFDTKRQVLNILGMTTCLEWLRLERAPVQTSAAVDAVTALAYSPDAGVFAVGAGADVCVYNHRDGRLRTVFSDVVTAEIVATAVDAAGALLFVGEETRLSRIHMQTGEVSERVSLPLFALWLSRVDRTPGGDQMLLVLSPAGAIIAFSMYDLGPRGRQREWQASPRSVTAAAFCAETITMAVGGEPGILETMGVSPRAPARRMAFAVPLAPAGVSLSRTTLVAACGEELLIWRLESPAIVYGADAQVPLVRVAMGSLVSLVQLYPHRDVVAAVLNTAVESTLALFDAERLCEQSLRIRGGRSETLALLSQECCLSSAQVAEVPVNCTVACPSLFCVALGTDAGAVVVYDDAGALCGSLAPNGDNRWCMP